MSLKRNSSDLFFDASPTAQGFQGIPAETRQTLLLFKGIAEELSLSLKPFITTSNELSPLRYELLGTKDNSNKLELYKELLSLSTSTSLLFKSTHLRRTRDFLYRYFPAFSIRPKKPISVNLLEEFPDVHFGLRRTLNDLEAHSVAVDLPWYLLPTNNYERFTKLRLRKKPPRLKISENATVFLSDIVPLSVGKSTRKIVRIHDLLPLEYPHFFPRGSVLNFQIAIDYAVNTSTLLVVNSESTMKSLLRFYPEVKERVFVIPCAIPAPMQTYSKPETLKIISRLSSADKIKKTFNYFITVATHEPRKNLNRLFEAFDVLSTNSKFKNFGLVVVGSRGWGFSHDTKTYNKNIIFLDGISEQELHSAIRHASCFVSPSISEGFGIPLATALTLRTPIACSNIEIFREITQGNAEFFNPYNSADIADGIRRAVNRKQGPDLSSSFPNLKYVRSLWTEVLMNV